METGEKQRESAW